MSNSQKCFLVLFLIPIFSFSQAWNNLKYTAGSQQLIDKESQTILSEEQKTISFTFKNNKIIRNSDGEEQIFDILEVHEELKGEIGFILNDNHLFYVSTMRNMLFLYPLHLATLLAYPISETEAIAE